MLIRRLAGVVLAGALCAGTAGAAQNMEKVGGGTSPAKASAGSVKNEPAAPAGRKLVVYYFHGTDRCITCKKWEALTKEVIDASFAREVKAGRVEYRVVNVEKSGDEHFINDYGLYSKAVVLSDTKDGKQVGWKNLEKIWDKVGNEEAYKQYIREEVVSYLKAG